MLLSVPQTLLGVPWLVNKIKRVKNKWELWGKSIHCIQIEMEFRHLGHGLTRK